MTSGAFLRLLLAGNGALRPLTGTGVGLGALTTHGQTTTVAQALVAADLDLATDVGLNLAAKVTLDLERLLDVLAELCQVLVREVLAPEIRADAGGVKDFLGAGTADAVDVCQCDLHALFARKINTRETCHVGISLSVCGGLLPALPLCLLPSTDARRRR